MENTKKKLNGQSKIVKTSFSGSNITKYAALNTVAKYMNRQNIISSISSSFPTVWHNATKFGINQILIAISQGEMFVAKLNFNYQQNIFRNLQNKNFIIIILFTK